MTADPQDGWNDLPLPTDRPILGHTYDGEDVPVLYSHLNLWVRLFCDEDKLYLTEGFSWWQELPILPRGEGEANDD